MLRHSENRMDWLTRGDGIYSFFFVQMMVFSI